MFHVTGLQEKKWQILNIIRDAYLLIKDGIISDFGEMKSFSMDFLPAMHMIIMQQVNMYSLLSAIPIHILFMQEAVK